MGPDPFVRPGFARLGRCWVTLSHLPESTRTVTCFKNVRLSARSFRPAVLRPEKLTPGEVLERSTDQKHESANRERQQKCNED